MESPNELTVTDFELAEEGFSVVLTNAIEDQRATVEFLTAECDAVGRVRLEYQADGLESAAGWLDERLGPLKEMQFRAMRVLGLLEAAREREAGQLA
ncbi:hypothetical protein [Marinobacter sp. bablab_jr008]|uniref:hypothetical protein n=1 Tax=Marinobacter sp. bablab_jr008 TaxID=2755064 RepID=UPI0018F2039F|nr:hypothetical protein [Marinobacter sp. bablab_jr008]